MKKAPTSASFCTKTGLAQLSQTLLRKLLYLGRIIFIFFLFAVTTQSAFAQQQKIDSLLTLLQSTKADTSRVKLLHEISIEYLFIKQDKALEYAYQGLAISKKNGYKKGLSICLNALGRVYLNIGRLDSAMVCFEKRFKIISELKDSIGIAIVNLNLGIIFYRYQDYNKALEFYEKANKIFASKNEKNLLANGYLNIGNIYMDQAEYPIALTYYLKSCKLYEEEKNEKDIGNSLVNISIIYMYLKQYDKSKQYAFDAKVKFAKAGKLDLVAATLYQLSNIYFNEADYENSIKYLIEAKAIFDKTQTIYYQALINQGLGDAYLKLGDYEKALDYFNLALPIAKKTGDNRVISSVYGSIGETYIDIGNFRKALEYERKFERILMEINDKQSLLKSAQNFIEIFSRTNQPDSISKYFKRYQQLSDTIFNDQNNKSIVEMQAKYETEKKDKEILALNLKDEKKKNIIWAIESGTGLLLVVLLSGFVVFRNRKKREQAVLLQMVSENDMKALRSQMNPHFIFNCIHTINGLLDDLKVQESKICLNKFSALTRSVLENSTKREIPLSEELETIRLYMDLENMRFANPFRYQFVTGHGIDPETTLVPPLILQPFIENSIKHGFRDPKKSGQLKIEIRAEDEFLVCSVEDNGVGRTNTFNIKHLSGFKKESLGIKLTEERLELISKTKNVKSFCSIKDLVDENNNSAGTRVEMYLPFELSV